MREGCVSNQVNCPWVLIPHVEELQYAIPIHTRVYEIWMRYRIELVTPEGPPQAGGQTR
ncbi:MAG TPA: hypothetical protein VIV27_09465 [Halioglobus sp.]